MTTKRTIIAASVILILTAAGLIWFAEYHNCLKPWERRAYYARVLKAIDDPEVWAHFGQTRPEGDIAVKPEIFGGTLRRGTEHPTNVFVYIRCANPRSYNYFVVEFQYPSAKISGIRTTFLMF